MAFQWKFAAMLAVVGICFYQAQCQGCTQGDICSDNGANQDEEVCNDNTCSYGVTKINCIEKDGWSKDLTDKILNEMMTIFKGKAWFKPEKVFIPPKTYIFAPECPKLSTKGHVYVSGGGNHAEDNMAAHCGLPTKFYLTSAPCPDCAMMLYNMYNSHSTKPTIHIALRYQGKGKQGSEGNLTVNLHCLAMLMNAGFTLTPWNWSAFKDDYINNTDCKNSLKDMIDDTKYQDRYDKIDKAINDAKMMSGDHSQICSNAAKNG